MFGKKEWSLIVFIILIPLVNAQDSCLLPSPESAPILAERIWNTFSQIHETNEEILAASLDSLNRWKPKNSAWNNLKPEVEGKIRRISEEGAEEFFEINGCNVFPLKYTKVSGEKFEEYFKKYTQGFKILPEGKKSNSKEDFIRFLDEVNPIIIEYIKGDKKTQLSQSSCSVLYPGGCSQISPMIVRLMQDFGINAYFVEGGNFYRPGDDPIKRLHYHAYILVDIEGVEYIVDYTANQFTIPDEDMVTIRDGEAVNIEIKEGFDETPYDVIPVVVPIDKPINCDGLNTYWLTPDADVDRLRISDAISDDKLRFLNVLDFYNTLKREIKLISEGDARLQKILEKYVDDKWKYLIQEDVNEILSISEKTNVPAEAILAAILVEDLRYHGPDFASVFSVSFVKANLRRTVPNSVLNAFGHNPNVADGYSNYGTVHDLTYEGAREYLSSLSDLDQGTKELLSKEYLNPTVSSLLISRVAIVLKAHMEYWKQSGYDLFSYDFDTIDSFGERVGVLESLNSISAYYSSEFYDVENNVQVDPGFYTGGVIDKEKKQVSLTRRIVPHNSPQIGGSNMWGWTDYGTISRVFVDSGLAEELLQASEGGIPS